MMDSTNGIHFLYGKNNGKNNGKNIPPPLKHIPPQIKRFKAHNFN